MDDHDKPEWREATVVDPKDSGVKAATTWIGPLQLIVHGADDATGWWWTVAEDGHELDMGTDLASMNEAKAEALHFAKALMRKRKRDANAPTTRPH